MKNIIITNFTSHKKLQRCVAVLGGEWLKLFKNNGAESKKERKMFTDEKCKPRLKGFAIATDYIMDGRGLYAHAPYPVPNGWTEMTASNFLKKYERD